MVWIVSEKSLKQMLNWLTELHLHADTYDELSTWVPSHLGSIWNIHHNYYLRNGEIEVWWNNDWVHSHCMSLLDNCLIILFLSSGWVDNWTYFFSLLLYVLEANVVDTPSLNLTKYWCHSTNKWMRYNQSLAECSCTLDQSWSLHACRWTSPHLSCAHFEGIWKWDMMKCGWNIVRMSRVSENEELCEYHTMWTILLKMCTILPI